MNVSEHLSPEERRILASLGFADMDVAGEASTATAAPPAAPVTDETDSYPQHWLPGQHNDASEDAAAAVTAYVSQLRSGAMPADHETTPDYPANWL